MLATKTAEYSAGSSETTAVEVLLAIEDDRSAEPEPARTEEGPRVVWAVDGAGVVYLPQEERVRMEVVELEPYNPFDPHVLSARPRGRGRRSTRRCYACGATRAEHPSGRFCRICAVCGRNRLCHPNGQWCPRPQERIHVMTTEEAAEWQSFIDTLMDPESWTEVLDRNRAVVRD